MPEKPDHLTRVKELTDGVYVPFTDVRLPEGHRAALNWLLESHARLLAAAKAITPEVEQMARAMVGSLDRETDLLGQAWMVFVDQCRAAIEFAEPKE